MSKFSVGTVYVCVRPFENLLTLGNEYMVYGTPGETYVVDNVGDDNYGFTENYGAYLVLKDINTTPSPTNPFEKQVTAVLDTLKDILISKNEKYGNSALAPIRIFSKASATEQLLVRLDDKISRIRTQSITEDEDVLVDLLGYLVLLKISTTTQDNQ